MKNNKFFNMSYITPLYLYKKKKKIKIQWLTLYKIKKTQTDNILRHNIVCACFTNTRQRLT